MAQCPVCQADLIDDFGLIECAHCGAQVLVQVDGSVQHASQEEPSQFGFREPERELPADFEDQLIAELEEPNDERTPDLAPPVPEHEPLFEPEPDPEPEPSNDEPHEKPDIFADDLSDLPAEPPGYRAPATAPDSPDLSDIARFGNSEASSGRDGSLRYSLSIQGIDTVDVREALREALTDRKFIWDTESLLRSIRDGQLQLHDVTASKAFMLISRLRSLPVRVKWEQHAIHQP
jgi:hypothetical protein